MKTRGHLNWVCVVGLPRLVNLVDVIEDENKLTSIFLVMLILRPISFILKAKDGGGQSLSYFAFFSSVIVHITGELTMTDEVGQYIALSPENVG